MNRDARSPGLLQSIGLVTRVEKVHAIVATPIPPYGVTAVSRTSCIGEIVDVGIGTQRTGTRELANRENAVPCGPEVSLARLTPITRMLG